MGAPDLTHRRLEPEHMDQPGSDPALHRAALDKLAQLNALAGSAGTIWDEIASLGGPSLKPLRILDLATGAGDLPCRLSRRASIHGLDWVVDGADSSPRAIEHARERAAKLYLERPPKFSVLDALRDPLPRGYDIVTCSLFLHHLGRADAVALLARMRAAAERAVIVHDLVRSPAAWRFTWLVTRLLSRNRMILDDGLTSIEAAFTVEEAARLAQEAGLEPARISRRWPYRWICKSVRRG